jgi:hypothetical protein
MNLKTMMMKGLKSHDFHIIMERLMPVMFCGHVSDAVRKTLVEVSYFCKHLCAIEIRRDTMEQLEKEVPVFLCKLEKNIRTRFLQSYVASPYTSSI